MTTRVQIGEDTTVGELVRAHPAMRKALENLGIDYCCGGGRTVKEAAAEEGVSFAALEQALDEALHTAAADERNWADATAAELADHIEAAHHAYMKRELPRLAGMLAKLKKAHPRHLEMLLEVEDVFGAMRTELERHLAKEEIILFPLIRRTEAAAAAGQPAPAAPGGTVANPIGQMRREHESAAHALERMKKITDSYTLPADACQTMAAFYDGLKDMEKDLHEHVHLENNILFPKAQELEKESGGDRK